MDFSLPAYIFHPADFERWQIRITETACAHERTWNEIQITSLMTQFPVVVLRALELTRQLSLQVSQKLKSMKNT